MILLPQKVAYRGTLTGLRISAIDGTAFLDNCAALVPYADGSHLVEIYDASGRMLRGYLSAAGTGETLGSDALSGWDLTAPWETSDATVVDVNTFSATAAAGYVHKTSVMTSGALYKGSFDSSQASGTSSFRDGNFRLMFSDGTVGGYATASSVRVVVQSNAIANVDISVMQIQKVLAPSTSGATIVSAKGGATENFQYKNASFTYNAASYYCLIRKAR